MHLTANATDMKDAFWFRHDSNAQHDERILELRAEYGWEGYGIFWSLIEKMRDAPDYRLTMATMGGMATSMGLLKPKLIGVIDLACKQGLFALECESAYVFSPSLRRRLEGWEDKKAIFSEAGKKGAARKKALKEAAEAEATLAEKLREEQATLKPPLSHPDDSASRVEQNREEQITEEKKIEIDSASEEDQLAADVNYYHNLAPDGQPPKSPNASASHTVGAADVPTSVVPLYAARDYADISPALVLPFDSDAFRASWVTYRRYRAEELEKPLGGGMQEQAALQKLGITSGKNERIALAMIEQAISKGWKDLFPLDSSSPAFNESTTANPQRHAVTRSTYGNQANSAAARLHTPKPSAEAGWGYPGQ